MNASEAQFAEVQSLIAGEPLPEGAPAGARGVLQRLCRAAVRALPATGAGLSVMSAEGSQAVIAASDETSELVSELQFTLGEGPCLEAFASCRPVLVTDLAAQSPARWPAYALAARQHGVLSVFAFPLQIGAARLGVLDVHRDRTGSLSTSALAQALTFAQVALRTLLDSQEEAGSENPAAGLEDALSHRVELFQAQGMVQIQLGVSVAEAMARLRAYAYSHDRRLGEVAHDIVARRLNLERDDR